MNFTSTITPTTERTIGADTLDTGVQVKQSTQNRRLSLGIHRTVSRNKSSGAKGRSNRRYYPRCYFTASAIPTALALP